MFATTPAFMTVENDYRREQLRRAWGHPLPRLRRRPRSTSLAPRQDRGCVAADHCAVAGAR
jgi:hypothetical protein